MPRTAQSNHAEQREPDKEVEEAEGKEKFTEKEVFLFVATVCSLNIHISYC